MGVGRATLNATSRMNDIAPLYWLLQCAIRSCCPASPTTSCLGPHGVGCFPRVPLAPAALLALLLAAQVPMELAAYLECYWRLQPC